MEGAVVVVHADADVQRTLATALSAAGAEAVACPTARRGLNTCCALEPICLITEARPTDFDAAWLAAAIRSQPPAVAAIPVLVLRADGVQPTTAQVLAAGADAVVPWPLPSGELVAHVQALVAMASRIRERTASSTLRPPGNPLPSSRPVRAFSGGLDRVAVATVLALLELDRATGRLSLARTASGKHRLVLDLASGGVIGGTVGTNELRPLEAVDAAVHWGPGRFEFVPSAPQPLPEWAVGLTRLLRAAIGVGDAAVEIDEPPTRPRPEVKKVPPHTRASGSSGTQERIAPDAAPPAEKAPSGGQAHPPFRSTLVSQPAVELPPGPPPPKRRMSERLRAAIKVEAQLPPPRPRAAPAGPPVPRTDPGDDDDVIEAENEASPRRRR